MRRLALGCLVVLLSLLGAHTANADVFGPISLASEGVVSFDGGGGHGEQALYAHDPAISGDGRYVVFDGYFGGRTGVWRRELQPPYSLEPVAVGEVQPGSEACVGGSPCDAELPSISENGQYVSFTTTAELDPRNSTGPGANVYVRNMTIPESQPCAEETALQPVQPCAFTLVSAVNGKTQGLTYKNEGASAYGAVAGGRSAISAGGQEVAFVTTAVSNLAGEETPPLQVAVRNLSSGETELVSTEYDPASGQALPDHPVSASEEGVVVGGAYSPQSTPPVFPFENRAYGLPPAVGASISADGSTVAWMGRNVAKQARMLQGEKVDADYAEPLWRRISEGPLTPTRRITGGSQPEAPGCAESGELALPGLTSQSLADPCQGPFAVERKSGVFAATVGDSIPQMSADGYTVAFLASAQLISLGVDFGRSAEGETDDLYMADMHEGSTRVQALRPLTELASGHENDAAGDAPIVDVAVSPDGSQVAFTSERTEFPLASPSYVSQPTPVAGMSELFDVDLVDETLTRVSEGYEGGPSERPHQTLHADEGDPYRGRADGALSPSFTEDGNTLAFASTATNLVPGEENTPDPEPNSGSDDGSSVYVVHRLQFQAVPTETYVSKPPPDPPAGAAEWRLYATAETLPDGKVRIRCETPAAGVLSAYVQSSVPDTKAASVARVASRMERLGARAKAAQVKRYVALGFAWVDEPLGGFASLTLSLGPSFARLAARPGGLEGKATLTFSPEIPARAPILRTLTVYFRQRSHPRSGAHASSHRAPGAAHRR